MQASKLEVGTIYNFNRAHFFFVYFRLLRLYFFFFIFLFYSIWKATKPQQTNAFCFSRSLLSNAYRFHLKFSAPLLFVIKNYENIFFFSSYCYFVFGLSSSLHSLLFGFCLVFSHFFFVYYRLFWISFVNLTAVFFGVSFSVFGCRWWSPAVSIHRFSITNFKHIPTNGAQQCIQHI